MFSFFKKKKPQEAPQEAPAVDATELLAKAEELAKQLETAAGQDDKVKLLNEMGECYAKAGETDKAISCYEQSLDISKQLGKAYTDLLKLYNQKRQEAATAGDDAKMKEYMDKVQSLMQSSKDVLRGKA